MANMRMHLDSRWTQSPVIRKTCYRRRQSTAASSGSHPFLLPPLASPHPPDRSRVGTGLPGADLRSSPSFLAQSRIRSCWHMAVCILCLSSLAWMREKLLSEDSLDQPTCSSRCVATCFVITPLFRIRDRTVLMFVYALCVLCFDRISKGLLASSMRTVDGKKFEQTAGTGLSSPTPL